MADLVGTCPKGFWMEWLAEGGLPGEEPGPFTEWVWYTNHHLARAAKPGDRFYVVAHGKLRGYAPIVKVEDYSRPDLADDMQAECRFGIVRQLGAVACTIPQQILGFRGLRLRWWKREDEIPFPDWMGISNWK